ncbi:MAG: DNA methyltransferase [Candidatus Competibacteraceae bacterium]
MLCDSTLRDHQAWLGYLQPDGLVVSPAALVDAQVILPREVREEQARFIAFVTEVPPVDGADPVAALTDFAGFARDFLEWPADLLYGFDPIRPLPEALCAPLPDFGERLAPDFALADIKPQNPDLPWLLLGQVWPVGTNLDAAWSPDVHGWPASPTRRLERLLRETGVPIGLLCNGVSLRLLYAPRGENAGSLTFPVAAMLEVAGRPILAALQLLLRRSRLFTGPVEARLPALLAKSREYQNTVSEALARQVLEALYELLRGLQAADARAEGALLREVLQRQPDSVYGGLITVLLRLVFLLYAEDRGLLPSSSLYVQHYSVHGLFEKLRADHERYPDTMDHRFGAWARLLALFRAVHGGCRHPELTMPARRGHLFDPDRFPFLEGRTLTPAQLPLVDDGVIYRVLAKLLVLQGERLSYRTLDVEQIGGVYEVMMGFRLEIATGPSIALRPKSKGGVGAPGMIDLNGLLAVKPAERAKWLLERTDQKLEGKADEALKRAATRDELLVALERRIARQATPAVVPAGGLLLQPSLERRRSGSHYTPRSLTEPIVRATLEPVLARLGAHPTPARILDLKICDPALGSGAFLVEVCRQLADVLVTAWRRHGGLPLIPPDEDELLHARRLIAQRCLYGVDRNPMAVDLAKLSLWLVTLAREHPFTFLDHAIRGGDSLVGLTTTQIRHFHWRRIDLAVLGPKALEARIDSATRARREILDAGDELPPELKRQKLDVADEALNSVRLAGDCVIAAFFAAQKDSLRENRRDVLLAAYTEAMRSGISLEADAAADELRRGEWPLRPFHWEIEFPEVFRGDNPGFDAIVGNPPFAGKNTLINGNRAGYLDWLKELHAESHGNADLVAHFFRRAFTLLRRDGCFGLIATNTIGQGDTRSTGLRWICTHDGVIYRARKRLKWPGVAAVVVSVVHVTKYSPRPRAGEMPGIKAELDGSPVERITAYLFHAGGHEDPARLKANENKSFQGSIVLGMGFTFDDTDKKGVATPIADMHRLIEKDPRNAERIFPYIGGEEVNDSPTHVHHRYVINFGDMTEEAARQWPDLMEIVERRVKPIRAKDNRALYRNCWWQYAEKRIALYRAIRDLPRVLVINCGATPHMAFAYLAANYVFANTLAVLAFDQKAVFTIVQSRPHEAWARFFGSSMKDDLRYTPSDCFETFPFPKNQETNTDLESAGRAYYEFRAELMVKNNQGLTATYNRFHDPDETNPDILQLRELHAAMDRAVLNAYGWNDIPTACEFLLDYEEDEDEDDGKPRKRKKPWRYRWSDEVRDEVLARLLALNAERAREEKVHGETAKKAVASRQRREHSGAADTQQHKLL